MAAPRGVLGTSLALLGRAAGSPALDRLRLRKPAERLVYRATKTGLRTAAAASRTFRAARTRGAPVRPPSAGPRGLFDLTPTDEQRLIQDLCREFAADRLRPAAADADAGCAPPDGLLDKVAADLGATLLTIPEALGGAGGERSATTNMLVAEALAHGDMGLALACLAPSAVSTALTLWGDAGQQATYLPAFVGEDVPAAALAVQEPGPLFDPLAPSTRARRAAAGFVLEGTKSLVPLATRAELFVVAADLAGRPALFVVESGTPGITVEPEPAMGLRGAALGRVHFDATPLPADALLGDTGAYADCLRLARVGWCALAVGTAQAVLDYVIPYVNDRVAFGEPISHRQSVAFSVADIAIELEGMRLATYRAASRAEQGKPFAREAALARALCGKHGMAIGSAGVQLLGGHGFVKEHPVERWYRDLRAVAVMEGAVLV